MSTVLEKRDVLNPATGELHSLALPDENLIDVLARSQMLRHEIVGMEKAIERELIERMDRGATWTLNCGSMKATSRSPEPPDEFDVERLRHELAKLVESGVISEEAAKAAVKTEVSYRVQARGIAALRKLGPVVVEAVDSCKREVNREEYARRRSVRVTVQQ